MPILEKKLHQALQQQQQTPTQEDEGPIQQPQQQESDEGLLKR